MKKSNIKKYLPILGLMLILGICIALGLNTGNSEEADLSGYENSKENNIIANEEIILSKSNEADLAVDYSNIKNLVNESQIIAIVKIESEEGKNYNPVRKEYVPVYTTGTLKVKEIIQNNSDVLIAPNETLEYVRLGGKITFSEYLKGVSESERNKLVQNISSKTKLTTEQMAVKLVKDIFVGDIEIEQGKEYLVFLKYTKDYGKYNILGFEYGLREYDSETMNIKNNKTNNFESINQLKNSIMNIEK
ncbi:MAG: hypothetical protein IJX34_00750 [Clostridia bacterium]|nr:hypothetical protein [Clostridia bacterium]